MIYPDRDRQLTVSDLLLDNWLLIIGVLALTVLAAIMLWAAIRG